VTASERLQIARGCLVRGVLDRIKRMSSMFREFANNIQAPEGTRYT
jgi:hypothetical protein